MRILIAVLGTPLVELVWGAEPKPDAPAPKVHADGQGQFDFGFGRASRELQEREEGIW
jgi:hypothetical protein